ncbi:MAG: hypothetical protein IT359_18290 [Gemmatimonadaceae bacterium]|nr:hypothetical protein [Gemmatimonadaceae bacterium]
MKTVKRVRFASLVLGLATGVPGAHAFAQRCSAPSKPYFEFEVAQPATFIADSTVSPRPSRRRAATAAAELALVQFVVDSSGVPDPQSFKVLVANDRDLVSTGRAVLARWRFRPARLHGCAVPQLVQTPLEP